MSQRNLFRAGSLRSLLDTITGEKDLVDAKKDNDDDDDSSSELSFFNKDGQGSFALFLFIFMLLAIETVYVPIALIQTSQATVQRKCEHSLLWYYLLNNFVFMKTFGYLYSKISSNLNDATNIVYLLFTFMLYNCASSYWGYNEVNASCVKNEFQSKRLWQYSFYYMYIQGGMSIILAIPIGYCIKQKCFPKITSNNNDETSEEHVTFEIPETEKIENKKI